MVVKTTKGMYEVIKNVRDAFKIDVFQNIYLEEYFDSYQYIVGDIASNTTRLKGFSLNPGKPNYFKYIPEYLAESCAYRGAYFILRRINDKEYESLSEKYKKNPNKDITVGEEKGFTLEKKPFDKENLTLASSEYRKPHIVFDMNRINYVKSYSLPSDLKEDTPTNGVSNKKASKEFNAKVENTSAKNIQKDGKVFGQNEKQDVVYKSNNQKNNNQKQNTNSFNNNKKAFSNNNGRKAFSNNKKNR